jgi:hypothetical protein
VSLASGPIGHFLLLGREPQQRCGGAGIAALTGEIDKSTRLTAMVLTPADSLVHEGATTTLLPTAEAYHRPETQLERARALPPQSTGLCSGIH